MSPSHLICDALDAPSHSEHLAVGFFDEQVGEVSHFGSFSCRAMRGSSNMSEHATANAFDIAGFRTKSGKVISVKRDWNSGKAEDKFLHSVRVGLCDWFNATLSPNYNASHADHFQVDMGWWQTCR